MTWSGEPSCFFRSLRASVSLFISTISLSFWAGGALARSSAFFSIWASSFSASGNLSLSIACRWLEIFLVRASVCLVRAFVSSFGLGLGHARFAGTQAGTKSMETARPAGIRTTQARRGSLGPNAEVTSRSASFRIASASERPAGRRLAQVAGQGQRGAQPLVEMEGVIDGHRGVEPARPAEDRDQGGDQQAQAAGDRERRPLRARAVRGSAPCAIPSDDGHQEAGRSPATRRAS